MWLELWLNTVRQPGLSGATAFYFYGTRLRQVGAERQRSRLPMPASRLVFRRGRDSCILNCTCTTYIRRHVHVRSTPYYVSIQVSLRLLFCMERCTCTCVFYSASLGKRNVLKARAVSYMQMQRSCLIGQHKAASFLNKKKVLGPFSHRAYLARKEERVRNDNTPAQTVPPLMHLLQPMGGGVCFRGGRTGARTQTALQASTVAPLKHASFS